MRSRPLSPIQQLTDEIVRLNGRLRTVFADSVAAIGISPMEASVLAAVVEAERPATVSQMGRSLGHPRQNIQRAANALLRAGLIKAVANPGDKRAALLKPTEKGKKLKRTADVHAAEIAKAFLGAVGDRRCARLAAELHTLRSDIEAYLRARKHRQA